MAAAVRGGAATKLPAGKIIPAQRWTDGAPAAKAASAPKDTRPDRQSEGAPARRENTQIETASRHGLARPFEKTRGPYGGARRSAQYPATRPRSPVALGPLKTTGDCPDLAASI